MGCPTDSEVKKKLVATSCAVALRSDRIVNDDMPDHESLRQDTHEGLTGKDKVLQGLTACSITAYQ
jgi:hypothetical protein